MTTKPFPYQREIVTAVAGPMRGRALIAAEMGLGKSLMSLLVARKLDAFPLLVICPATVKWQWQRECAHHLGLRAEVVGGCHPPRRAAIRTRAPVLVINYDVLAPSRNGPGWIDWLRELRPGMVVIDECHYLLDPKAKRSRAVIEICRGVGYVLALSGTPLVNRPDELFCTLNILRPADFPNRWRFQHRYCGPRRTPWGWTFKGATHLDELHEKLRPVCVRRRKVDVLKDLPPLRRIVLPLELRKRREYDAAVKDFVGWMRQQAGDEAAERAGKAAQLTQLTHLKQLVGKLKLPNVLDWVDDFLAGSDGKLVLFAVHRAVIRSIRERYARLSVVVDGSVTGRKRQAAVDRFQRDAKTRLFIGNVKAAGVGLNLTAASTVAFAEFAWAPGTHTQAEARCHRIGTRSAVEAYYLVARGTLEATLVQIIQRKQRVLNSVLDGKGKGDRLDVYDQLTNALLTENGHA